MPPARRQLEAARLTYDVGRGSAMVLAAPYVK
jgi:hypothetical protein